MIGYKIEIKGLEEQLEKLEGYDKIANKHLKKAMHSSVITVASAVRPLTPVGVSGDLRRSIGSKVAQKGNSIIGQVGSSLKGEVYPSVMEFGRQPGSMPPPSALERWVQRKLGVSAKEAPGVAFAVALKIKRKGIKGKRFMKKGWLASKAKVQTFFGKALDRIAEELSIGS